MTILQALTANYQRLLAINAVPEFGYSNEAISFGIVLSLNGELLDVLDCRDTTNGTPRPLRNLPVPRPPQRRTGSKVVPNFLWDNTDYALGVSAIDTAGKPIHAQRGQFDAFKQFHLDLLADSDDKGLIALKAFVESWNPGQFSALPYAEDMAGTNVIFRLDGTHEYLHERPAAKSIWRNQLATLNAKRGLCLVTAERAPIARLHPKIKGIWGGRAWGAPIVSFNLGAFESYGRIQGANAPVSEWAAFAYTTALNAMLVPESRQKIRVGDTTIVFWAEAAGTHTAAVAEDLLCMALEPRDDAQEPATSEVLAAIMKGRPVREVRSDVNEHTPLYVLGLTPNASRLSVRFWHEGTIGTLVRRIGEHWRDFWIEPSPWRHAPVVWRLLVETAAQREGANIQPTLSGQLMRAILTGARYPHTLLVAVILRMRADKIVNGTRVAICKACLARDHRLGFEQENVSVSLDREENNPAYLLGRLFAVYESLQMAALGRIKATIKDRYFGIASATPASVFPLLERSSAGHVASLKKLGNVELARQFDTEIDSIVERLNTMFPRNLRLEDQGRFAIGYHHQRGRKHLEVDAITNDRFED